MSTARDPPPRALGQETRLTSRVSGRRHFRPARLSRTPRLRAEQLALLDEIGKPNLGALTAGSAVTFLAIFNAGGSASYKLMLIVVNGVVKGVIGRGLSWAADAALVRVMGIATGPVGWALASLLTFIQIAAPSYKVTIPCVAYVAMLRKAQRTLRCTKCEAVVDGGFRFCPACGEKIGATS